MSRARVPESSPVPGSDGGDVQLPSRIPLCEPLLAGRERAYLLECLDSGWISSVGPFVGRFEQEIAKASGVPQAVATASGSAALHLALRVLGVGPGDGVAVSTLSFVAPANAVRYVGARPVFVDAEPRHWQLDADSLRSFLDKECESTPRGPVHRATGLRMRAVIAVHVLGHPADLQALRELTQRHGLHLVEDAAEALGASCAGRLVGGQGDLGCFSFNGNKTVTTGGGGALVTRDAGLAERARHLATQAKCDALESIHDDVGFNYRMTGLQAAVGCAQLEALPGLLRRKRLVAERYREALAGLPGVSFQAPAAWAEPSHWLFALRIGEAFGASARALLQLLREDGIEARPLWQPLHQSPAHAGAARVGGRVAEALQQEVVCLPSSPGLSLRDQRRVIDRIRDCARSAARSRDGASGAPAQ